VQAGPQRQLIESRLRKGFSTYANIPDRLSYLRYADHRRRVCQYLASGRLHGEGYKGCTKPFPFKQDFTLSL